MTVSTKTELREAITRDITTNGAGEISGADLSGILGDMVDSWPDPGDGGGVTPVQGPVTYALWLAADDNLPDINAIIANGTEGARTVTLPADSSFPGAVTLVAAIPHDRWPLPGRPDLSGTQGGLSMQLYDSSLDGAWALIQSNELSRVVAETVRTVTWWPA